ncbi:MAG TPA: MATE family efflux transporter [Alphaproteobacteria bacterium]|nr:MATE family efflux transporter [Alphaproteobacteria bacterium]
MVKPARPAAPAAWSVYREAWRLAWPLILSNLTVPLLGIVDTAVVGHLPDPHYLGAVALGALTFNVLYFVFGFLRMGTTGLTAQAYGRADADELRAGLGRPLLLGVVIAVLLIAAGPLIVRLAVLLFEPTARVGAAFANYVGIRLLGAPAGLANLVLLGWLLGLQNARGPMALLIVTNAVNIALDLIFVLGLGWAVSGVAAATVCAEYAGLALGLWLARRQLNGLAGSWRWSSLWQSRAFRRLLAVNRDIMLRSLSLEAAFLAFTALSSRQGEVVLAGNAVLLNFLTFAAFGLDGFAHAAEAMVGRHVGRGDAAGFRAATHVNLVLALALAVALALAFAAGGRPAIELMTGLAAVRATALTYLPYVVALPLIAVFAFLFDGVFIGATRTVEMRNGMALALGVFLLAVALLMPPLGNHGLWLAMLLLMGTRGLWLGTCYLQIERNAGFVSAPATARAVRRPRP